MSKSSQKRKQAANRRRELEKLRGVSLLDDASPMMKGFENSPNPENADHLKNYGKSVVASPQVENGDSGKSLSPEDQDQDTKPSAVPIGSESLARKRIDFVLPRAKGKADRYLFDKQARVQINEELPTIPEEGTPEESVFEIIRKKHETLDDILFSSKKRKLGDKFEAVHRAVETKEPKTKNPSPPPSPEPSKKKKKRRRSSSGERQDEIEKKEAFVTKRSNDQQISQSSMEFEPQRKTSMDSTGGKDRTKKEPDKRFEEAVRSQRELVHRQLSGRSVEEAVKDKTGLRPRANSTDGELNLPQRGLCDEQMVLRAHRWKEDRNYVHQVAPRGLVNLGNTCFLNSILQCLAYLPPFCQSLITISETKMKEKNGGNKKRSQGPKITWNLCNLFQRVHGFRGGSDASIAPQAIVKSLPSLGSCGSRNGYKFRPGRQEDAHEFLIHLLDAMHDGELKAAGINQHASGWRDRLPVTRLDETTFIHRIFGGYFRSQVRCKACGYNSNTYDPFMDLSLEVSKKSSNSVSFAISEFTRKETLDADNQWKCSGCKKYVCPTKQLTVFRPPLSLCIQLKRFAFDGPGGRAFSSYGAGGGWKHGKSNASFRGGSKITKPIEFPADLNLPLSDGRSCPYTLTGVVIHVGGSASSGHYTAYVKRPGRKGKIQWYHADDSFVEPVSEKTVLRQKDAYILFYCRKEVKLEFPSPPPRTMSTEEAQEFGRARARARADSSATTEEGKRAATASTKVSKQPTDGLPGDSAPLKPAPTQDGVVRLTKATIHPLADFLNTTMAAQFKATMTPIPITTKNKDVTESSSDDSEESEKKFITEKGGAVFQSSQASSQSNLKRDSYQSKYTDGGSTTAVMEANSSSSDSSGESQKIDHALSKDVKPPAKKKKSEAKEVESSSSSSEESTSNESTEIEKPKEPASPHGVARNSTKEKTSSEGGSVSRLSFPKGSNKTRIVVGQSDSRGKVKVMLGPRKRKLWAPNVTGLGATGAGFHLLGNRGTSKWGEEDDQKETTKKHTKVATTQREKVVAKMEKQEKSRKRRLHLDRWDSLLDQGKTKKTKNNPEADTFQEDVAPKKNVFQRIQSGIQRMNKGKAKGLFRRKTDQANNKKGRR